VGGQDITPVVIVGRSIVGRRGEEVWFRTQHLLMNSSEQLIATNYRATLSIVTPKIYLHLCYPVPRVSW
jgi:hypothetical protein